MQKEDLINALLDELESSVPTQRYIHYFDSEITKESVQSLIDHLHGCPQIDLYFSTHGGEMTAMKVLIKFLNNHPDINVYLTDLIASAGTFLLTDYTGNLFLDEGLELILFHLGDRPVEGQFRKTTFNTQILFEQLQEENNKYVNKFKELGLNSKEIKRILEGDDVILYRKDFERLKLN